MRGTISSMYVANLSIAAFLNQSAQWKSSVLGTLCIGHATLHPGDVVAQTRETIANIEAVLVEANRVARQARFVPADLHYKVYVRDPGDLNRIRAELTRYVGGVPKAIYLQADVCRQDLLLEIEAIAAPP